ncbi:hypothetical protein PaecuDRAFT_4586 [Paenibacillus curdlanolyticus YK9]|uniref:DUF2752 domain-containing protein n=1 Tax=Paenibacillus curdlanolyticus YK9 TaxID=717606 RepID=E0IFZ5_9BACL|nr:hypothetical protein PaecuDRAFT_4586 [Paenibacillus curdlanolyticus YK9]
MAPIRRRNLKLAWGSSFVVGGLLYLKVWLPLTGLGIPCLFHELTGFYCPGCGVTRAAKALLALDMEQAFRYNSLIFALLPLYLAYFIANKKQLQPASKLLMAAMLTLTISFGILRNIPEFSWLAPHAAMAS